MFEKFTERARKVMSLSRQEAQRKNSNFIDAEHIFLGILREDGGIAAEVIKHQAGNLARVLIMADSLLPGSKDPSNALGQIPFSPGAKAIIEKAGTYVTKDNVIGTESLLLAILENDISFAHQTMKELDINPELVKYRIKEHLKQGGNFTLKTEEATTRVIIEGTIVECDEGDTFFNVLQRDGSRKRIRAHEFGLDPAEMRKCIGRRIRLTNQADFLD